MIDVVVWGTKDIEARTLSHLRWALLHRLLESLETVQKTVKVRLLAQCVDDGGELLV